MLLAIVIAPYYNIRMPGGGIAGAALLLACGAVLAWLSIQSVAKVIGNILGSRLKLGLTTLLAIGLSVQVGAAVITAPIPESDMEQYLLLAERLASDASYESDGRFAYLPPGLPLTLAPFVKVFGANLHAVIVMNAMLYAASVLALWTIAVRLFGRAVAAMAVALFSIWPTRLLMAGLASKENLTLAMLLVGIALALKAFDPSTRRPVWAAFGSGAAFGLGALAQPGLALFVAMTPLMYRFAARTLGKHAFITRLAVILAGMALCIAPWTVRNCIVFEGKFCGISTNGGSVFYRANNPQATGTWTDEGEIAIEHLPELEQNELGFRLGREWIMSHPLQAAALSMRKLIYLLGTDDYGPYWGILRATGLRDEEAYRINPPARIATFHIANIVSLVFWVLLAALCVRALLIYRAQNLLAFENVLPLVYPLLYSACVFAVFESGSRQHIAATGPLFILAASACAAHVSDPRWASRKVEWLPKPDSGVS